MYYFFAILAEWRYEWHVIGGSKGFYLSHVFVLDECGRLVVWSWQQVDKNRIMPTLNDIPTYQTAAHLWLSTFFLSSMWQQFKLHLHLPIMWKWHLTHWGCNRMVATALFQYKDCLSRYRDSYVNTLRPRQNGRQFPDSIFKCIFLNENVWIWLDISLMFVPKVQINHIPALV